MVVGAHTCLVIHVIHQFFKIIFTYKLFIIS
jgi:hypothetical protein